MTDMQTIRTVTVKGQAQGFDQVNAALNATANAQVKVAETGARVSATTTTTEKSVLRVGQAFDRMRQSIDDTYRNQVKFEAGQRLVDTAMRQGAIDALAHGDAMDRLRQKYLQAADGVHQHSTQLGFNRVQMMESVHVVKSLVDSIIAGQSPLRAFAVEGGRIGQIFAEGKGSVGTQLKGLAGQIGGLAGSFGPAVAGTVAIAGAVIGGVASWYTYVEAVEKAEVAVGGIGRFAGVSAEQLVRLADSQASAARISDGTARQLASDFASTGKIGADMIGKLIDVSKDFAATTGTDMKKAGEDLAKAFADPAKGAEELNAKLGFLDDKTAHYIETLAAQNDRAGAQAALLEAMKPSLDDAATHVTGLGYAWDRVTTAARNAFNAMGSAIDRATSATTPLQKLQDLQAMRSNLPNSVRVSIGAGNKGAQSALDSAINDLTVQIQEERERSSRRANQVEGNRQSEDAGARARRLTPGYSSFEGAKNDLASQNKDLDNPLAVRGMSAETYEKAVQVRERLTNQIKSMTDANGQFVSSEQNRIALMQKEADLAKDRKDPAKARADASEIDRLKLYGKALTDAEIAGQTSAAGDRSFNRAEARSHTDGFTKSTLPNFEKGTAELYAQAGDVGKTPDVLAREKAVLELTTAAKRDYGTVTDGVRAKIEQEADSRAAALKSLDDAKDRYRAVQDAEKLAADAGVSLFDGALKGANGFRSALQGVIQSLEKALINSALLGTGPLAGLFGTGAQGAGQVGGLFGSLFGNTLKGAGSLFGSLFSGFHANGGTVGPGQWGIAGENGPEPIFGGTSGLGVVPFAKVPAGNAGPATIIVHHTMDLSGANGDSTIRAIAAESGRQAFSAAVEASRQQFPGWQLDLQQRGSS